MKYTMWFDGLSLREQCAYLTGGDAWHTAGSDRLGIPRVHVSDGPNGLRIVGTALHGASEEAVCFPSASAMAASWDRDNMFRLGETLGGECRAKQVHMLLGPGINLKRSPLCGRNFEYYSEDPVLAGELAANYVNGVQSKGVGTSLKHFAANSTEASRMLADSIVDDRALHELYLKPFEITVKKAQPWSVMASYNKINGTYSTENSWLLQDTLRDSWGFRGLVVSDWGAVNDRVAALKAGTDLDMPGTGNYTPQVVYRALNEGTITEDEIHTSVSRVFDLAKKVDDLQYEEVPALSLDADHATAVSLAEGCPVLLKNEHGTLPLRKEGSLAILGARAKDPLLQGKGSSHVAVHTTRSPYDCLLETYPTASYAEGYKLNDVENVYDGTVAEAVAAAEKADQVLVFVSCRESDVTEGSDRENLSLSQSMNKLVEAVAAVNRNVVVVLTTGGSVELPWADDVPSILQTNLLGEGFGEAIAKILTGEVSPSGKLPETYPLSLSDVPAVKNLQPDQNYNLLYKESIFMGYRFYEKAGRTVRYPFGHGLSYGSFVYEDLQIDKEEIKAGEDVTVTFKLSNHGAAAAEVPQLYVGYHDPEESYLYRAVKELKDFTKVFLGAGETKEVSFTMKQEDFAYYSTEHEEWRVEPGRYDLWIGSSSADIRLSGGVNVLSDVFGDKDYKKRAPNYFYGDIDMVEDQEFYFLLRYNLEDFTEEKKHFDRNSCLRDSHVKAEPYIEDFLKIYVKATSQGDPAHEKAVFDDMVYMPINRFVSFNKGLLSDGLIDAAAMFLDGASAMDTLKMAVRGIPDAAANAALPLLKKVSKRIPDNRVPSLVKALGKGGEKLSKQLDKIAK